jgi:ABC-2 type transport system permease protein
MKRVRTLIVKEFLELRRMPQLLRLILVAPVVQLGMLGYAATTDIADVPVVVVDADRSAASRELIGQIANSRYFRIVADEQHPREIDDHLARGVAWLAITIPAGLGDALDGRGSESARTIQVIADGTDANSSGVALSYVQGLVAEFNANRAAEAGAGAGAAVRGQVRIWFNAELVSRNFMVPGVLALLLMLVTTNLASMAIVRERELGTLDQLNVTPLSRWELVLGKLLPYGLVGFVDVLLVLAVAVLWFAVPLRGSVALLLGASMIYLLCTLGLGLFISTTASTQQQAMMTAIFFFMVPMIYLSGFIFPIENMPQPIQWITYAIPLRYFLIIVRGIFLKGVGLDVLWPQLAALAGWGAVVLALAVARSRKRA